MIRAACRLAWGAAAEWCLTDPRGMSVFHRMWLTDGDPSWGFIDGRNGPWVTGRGQPPPQHAPW